MNEFSAVELKHFEIAQTKWKHAKKKVFDFFFFFKKMGEKLKHDCCFYSVYRLNRINQAGCFCSLKF